MGGVPVGVDGVPVGVLPKAQASEGRRIVGDLGVRWGDLGAEGLGVSRGPEAMGTDVLGGCSPGRQNGQIFLRMFKWMDR